MSSFKPDPAYSDLAFRPARPGAMGLGSFLSEAGDRLLAESSSKAKASACTSDQHAELERLAFEKGLASAQADQARCERACGVLEQAAAAMGRVSLRLLHENRAAMLELAAEVARAWIGAELRLDPARFAGPLESALALCAGSSSARLHLHPEVLAALDQSLPEWTARWSDKLAVEVAADADLSPAEFRIETATQSIDAGLDSLAPRLREALAAAFETSPPEAAAC